MDLVLSFCHPARLFHRVRLSTLRDRFRGSRCFIMGNGPSLNQMDLEKLAGEQVWGLNKCNLLFNRISWRPAFHVGVDRVVVPDMREDLLRMCRELPATRFFLPNYFVDRGLIPIRNNMLLFQDVEDGADQGFSPDPSRFIYKSKTVTVVAIQLAVFLGFNPIYLIGCDTSYFVPETVLREGTAVLRSTEDDDPNHFAQNYFGKAALWRDPNPDAMLANYERIADVARTRGVEIRNATVGGRLEAFPRVDFEELMAKRS